MDEILITSPSDLDALLQNNAAVLAYFSSPTCNVCQVLRPKVMSETLKRYPQIVRAHIDLSMTPDIGANYSVLAAPTVILFLEGKEFIRKYRTISVEGLMQEIERPYSIMVG